MRSSWRFPGAVYAAVLLTDGLLRRVGIALGFVAAMVGANIAIVAYADAVAVGEKVQRTALGLRALATFDLVGIAAERWRDSRCRHSRGSRQRWCRPTRRCNSACWRRRRARAVACGDVRLALALGAFMTASPRAYLSHRAAHLGDLFWRPCFVMIRGRAGRLPNVYVPSLGRDIMPELGLKARWNRRDRVLRRWPNRLQSNAAVQPGVLVGGTWRRGHDPRCCAAPPRRSSYLRRARFVFVLGFGVDRNFVRFRYVYIVPVAATILLFAVAITFGPAAPVKTTVGRDRHVPAR